MLELIARQSLRQSAQIVSASPSSKARTCCLRKGCADKTPLLPKPCAAAIRHWLPTCKARTNAALSRRRGKTRWPWREDQRIIAQQIAALDGRLQDRGDSEALKARAGLVGDLAKAYNGPMGAPMGADKQPIPFEQFAAPAI